MILTLERCKRTDPHYLLMRNRHYVPNHGCHGQQMHYLVFLEGKQVGIISGASAVWAVASRDVFFGITKDNRKVALPSVINNVVFRLEDHQKNLATQVLAVWRVTIAKDWEARYNVKAAGFETFVVEEPYRKGTLYKADNWTYLGQTSGQTKTLIGGPNRENNRGGIDRKMRWVDTPKKLVFAKKVKGVELSTSYQPTWRGQQPGEEW